MEQQRREQPGRIFILNKNSQVPRASENSEVPFQKISPLILRWTYTKKREQKILPKSTPE